MQICLSVCLVWVQCFLRIRYSVAINSHGNSGGGGGVWKLGEVPKRAHRWQHFLLYVHVEGEGVGRGEDRMGGGRGVGSEVEVGWDKKDRQVGVDLGGKS